MAMAPEQIGIGIRRFFSERGVHPYDKVAGEGLAWERRDARIPNFKDGTDAFFQPDVEFPVTWSQNATNIVAQKYFRGTLGTAEREWSLRQVVDRVADTIADWGVRDGYFVDDEEAEAFRDELKAILVTQRAAFNSPVWFNIGVKGVPQQASACQPYHALVSTPEGFVPIGKLVEDGAIGTKVFDANGLTKIVAVKHNGRKPVLRLHTKAGITLDVTGDHLVWRASDERYGAFVEAATLRRGDKLAWHRAESWGTGEISTREIAEAARLGLDAAAFDAAVPQELFTAPLPVVAAYLRIIFQAEGYVSQRERSSVVGLDMISEGVVRGVQQLLMRFGIYSRVRFKADSRADRKGCWSLSIRVAGDRRIFADEIGFLDPVKTDKLEATFELDGLGAYPVKRLEIDRVEQLGEMDVYDIQTESGEYLSNNLRVHNCFILAVNDTMDGILDWYREEGVIFKGGSGAGVNLSKIRSSFEHLKGGGTASGPVSFMRGADASAGTIKSGGKTRRAAKMVILDADHPDVEEFIWCKAREEQKARALRDAGFDMDLDGRDSHSIQYQNANNSVRVTDEFMQAVVDDRDWDLKAVTTGETIKTVKARELMREISDATWQCADPGMQFDTTINRWHTAPNTDRINASNPCFTADSLVHTDKGLLRFRELFDRANHGEEFQVYTHDVTNADAPSQTMHLTTPKAFMITGLNPIVRLRFDNGMELRCTPGHRIFTTNRGYVEAQDLTSEDRVRTLDLPTPAVNADWALPVTTDVDGYREKGDRADLLRFPELWSDEFAHYLGWLIGDGSTSGVTTSTVYGTAADRTEILPAHQELLEWLNGDRAIKVSEQANGTVQLRLSRRPFKRFLEALGVKSVTGAHKVVPWSIEQAPPEIVAAFLRGLFDADGCAVHNTENGSYVGLGSISVELLRGVQRLLSTFGIASRVYAGNRAAEGGPFSYTRADGSEVTYGRSASYDLRITSGSVERFAAEIGFGLSAKQATLRALVTERTRGFDDVDTTARLADRTDEGVELTYNLSEPRNHSYVVGGVVVRNCSEYMHIDNSACNLASINLLKYLDGDDVFDVDAYRHTVEVMFTAQEILVGNADYPTPKIGENSRKFRQLGLGYANLGALLMAQGLAYDSPEGRAWAGALTALMTGHAYATSARTAGRMGPFAGYAENAEPMLDVLRMHRAEAAKIDEELVPPELLSAAQRSWDEAVELGEIHGVRNAQSTVLAPTGTIGLMMDCDTTGIEPDLGLTKSKKLVGGGTMLIVNQTVPRALAKLGYSPEQADAIIGYVNEHKSIIGAPGFQAEHLPVFACSMGDNPIHYMGHVTMMGAVQPFISGAISKTVNMPEDVSVEDVEQLHIEAWRLGLKAVAIYRDNCKVGQPLSIQKKEGAAAGGPAGEAGEAGEAVAREVERIVETVIIQQPVRQKLPRTRRSKTFSFRVADCHGYVTVGEFEDGRPGELFLKVAKQGSTLAGIMDAFAISVSHGLQYGVPLEAFCHMFTNMRFEPAGMTDDPEIRFATSLVDYIFRRLAVEYLDKSKREELGILTVGERMQPTLPGVEEAALTKEPGLDVLPPEDRAPSEAVAPPAPPVAPQSVRERETVLCLVCGDIMQRAGSCYACPSCGATSGCS
ncbi:MAG: LAGLIDADG family homing endonuclease [Acidimicrobiia bacterium]